MPFSQAVILSSLFLFTLTLTLIFGGCSKGSNKNRVETITETPAEARLHYVLPSNWRPLYNSDGIRWGSFIGPKGVSIALTRFPGSVGDELMNINRWRAQLNLPPVNTGDKDSTLTALKDSKLPFRTTKIKTSDGTLWAAMSIAGGNSIVLKMNATPKEISNEKDEKELEDDFFNIVRNIAWE